MGGALVEASSLAIPFASDVASEHFGKVSKATRELLC